MGTAIWETNLNRSITERGETTRAILTAALATAWVVTASAQSASLWLAREPLGPFYNATDVRTLTPAPANNTGRFRIDFNDFQGDFYYAIKVTPYIRVNDYGPAQGISIINTWVTMSGFIVYTGFTQDESGFDNDDRKNAHSHPITGFFGQTLSFFDGAGNAPDYLNHDLLWWQRGGNVSGPAAFGKVIFDECEVLTIGHPMHCIVLLCLFRVSWASIGCSSGTCASGVFR